MVGMDSRVSLGKPKESDFYIYEELQFQPHESELPGELISYGKNSALSPITPNPCRESGDSLSMTSSMSFESPKSPVLDGPRTAKNGVFDPFAPAPEEMLLAPLVKKIVETSEKIAVTRLSFDDADASTSVPTILKKPESSPTTKVRKIMIRVILKFLNENREAGDFLTPEKMLLNSIEKVREAWLKELRKLERKPAAKKAEWERKVRTLMTMR